MTALGALEKCLHSHPELAILQYLKGALLSDRGQGAEAAQAFNRCLELEPKHGSAWAMLAMCTVQSNPVGAQPMARRALELDPHCAVAAAALALGTLTTGAADETLELLKDWLHADGRLRTFPPRHRRRRWSMLTAFLRGIRGMAQLKTPTWRNAWEDLRVGFEDNNNAMFRTGIAHGLVWFCLSLEAYERAEKYLRQLGNEPEAIHHAALLSGHWNYAQNRLDEAESAYRSALSNAHDAKEKISAAESLAWVAWKQGNPSSALQILQDVSEKKTALHAQLAYDSQQFTTAREQIKAWLENNPDDITGHHLSGLIHLSQKQDSDARSAFQRAVDRAALDLLSWRPERERAEDCSRRIR